MTSTDDPNQSSDADQSPPTELPLPDNFARIAGHTGVNLGGKNYLAVKVVGALVKVRFAQKDSTGLIFKTAWHTLRNAEQIRRLKKTFQKFSEEAIDKRELEAGIGLIQDRPDLFCDSAPLE